MSHQTEAKTFKQANSEIETDEENVLLLGEMHPHSTADKGHPIAGK